MIDIPMSTDEQIDEIFSTLLSYDWAKEVEKKRENIYRETAKKDILDLIRQEMFLARVDEATRACRSWEKKPGTPATYLIERIDELKLEIDGIEPGFVTKHPKKQ